MSTIQYKCDTCKREIELLENKQGFTVFGKCVITDGCRGRLYRQSRNPYNMRSYLDEPTNYDLKNYDRRRVLFKFEQESPKRKWTVRHNLGVFPTVVIYDTSDETAKPEALDEQNYTVTIIDKDTIEILFSNPVQGIIHCISRSTVEQVPEYMTVEESMTKITNDLIMSIGVLSKVTTSVGNLFTTGSILLNISIKEPNREEVFCSELVNGNIEPKSAWNDWAAFSSRNRRTYNIKTFDVSEFTVIKDLYDSIADIPDGTRLKILSVKYVTAINNFEEIRSRNMLGLLSKSPYATIDKVTDRFFDIGDISRSQENDYYTFISGELYIDNDNVERIYPHIKRVEPISPESGFSDVVVSSISPLVEGQCAVATGDTTCTVETDIVGNEYLISGGSGNYVVVWESDDFTVTNASSFTPTFSYSDSPGTYILNGVLHVHDVDSGMNTSLNFVYEITIT